MYYVDNSRTLFTDGYNSMWHFIFGIISIKYIIGIPIFIAYQFYDYNERNVLVDIIEFNIGLLAGYFLYKLLKIYIKKYKK